jgi:hypothetical protein
MMRKLVLRPRTPKLSTTPKLRGVGKMTLGKPSTPVASRPVLTQRKIDGILGPRRRGR